MMEFHQEQAFARSLELWEKRHGSVRLTRLLSSAELHVATTSSFGVLTSSEGSLRGTHNETALSLTQTGTESTSCTP